jgi:hypothetical protein
MLAHTVYQSSIEPFKNNTMNPMENLVPSESVFGKFEGILLAANLNLLKHNLRNICGEQWMVQTHHILVY